MKIIFIYLILTVFYFEINAQNGLCVFYEKTTITPDTFTFATPYYIDKKMPRVKIPKINLQITKIFTDSFNLETFTLKNKKKSFNLDSKLILVNKHHQVITDNKNLISYHLYNLTGKDKNPYLTIQNSDEKWIYYNDTINVLGYTCKAALSINKNGDSTLAWYTQAFGNKKGGLYVYNEINGVILKLYKQSNNLLYIATKIKFNDYKIIFPSEIEIKRNIKINKW